MAKRVPEVLRNRDFNLFWVGWVCSRIGVRGTLAVNLLHVYQLSESSLQVGIVGLFQGLAVLVLAPFGGAYADRLDRRKLLQVMQLLSMAVSLSLAGLSLAGVVAPWHIYGSVLLNTAAATFDSPARRALVPGLVPREQLGRAYALLNPSSAISQLAGPALGGLLVTLAGPWLMYLVDGLTYALLAGVVGILRIEQLKMDDVGSTLWKSIGDGFSFVRDRPIIWQLLSLDVMANLFGAWRVVLPELSTDVLGVSASGYGLLSSAPALGALVGSMAAFRIVRSSRAGIIVLLATIAYGGSCILLVQSSALPLGFWVAMAGAAAVGGTDTVAKVVRQAAVQLETPDQIRGRVSSIYQLAAKTGPSLGDLNLGWLSGMFGPVAALTAGGLVPIAYATAFLPGRGTVRQYRIPEPAESGD